MHGASHRNACCSGLTVPLVAHGSRRAPPRTGQRRANGCNYANYQRERHYVGFPRDCQQRPGAWSVGTWDKACNAVQKGCAASTNFHGNLGWYR